MVDFEEADDIRCALKVRGFVKEIITPEVFELNCFADSFPAEL